MYDKLIEKKQRKPRITPPNEQRCVHLHDGGHQCKVRRMIGFELCYFHEPSIKEKRLEASSRGGINRALIEDVPPPSMESVEDVRQFAVETLHQVRTGHIEPRTAAVISSLVAHILKTLPEVSGGNESASEKLRALLSEDIDVSESEENGEAGESLSGHRPSDWTNNGLQGI
mgnify:CR=1 FL=1